MCVDGTPCVYIEVRDSPNGIFGPWARWTRAPAKCPELLGRRRRRRRHLEIQVDIQARELLLKVFLRFWGRGERYLKMETGFLLRISLQTS